MISTKLATRFAAINRTVSISTRGQVTSASTEKPKVRPYEDIPGPKPLPIVGNAWRFLPKIGTIDMSDFQKFGEDMQNEYGDIVKLSNLPGRRDMVMLFNPELIEEVYKNEGQWPQRFVMESVKYFRDKIRPDFFEGNQGLVNENGEKWQEARSVINQPMMRVDVSNQYVPKTDDVAKDFVKLAKQIRNNKMEMPEDTNNELHKWALECMYRNNPEKFAFIRKILTAISLIALDTRLGCLERNLPKDSEAQRMIDAVVNVFALSFELDFKMPIWKLISTPTMKQFIKSEEEILDISLRYVEQARNKIQDLNAPETPDMSVLHRILKRDPHTKRAVIMGMDIILAGVDTTSNSAAIALYYLAKNPAQQEKLYREIKAVVPSDPNQSITHEHLNEMKYLKACIKEAMRLAPVAGGNMRLLQKDITLKNYNIPKGKADIIMFHGSLYTEDKHFPNADKFIPERWLRDDSVQCPVRKAHETHPYVYLPFGHGVRACPGMRFANMEMETLISRLLLEFKFEWHQPDMMYTRKALLTPNAPLKYTLIDRN